MGKIKINIKAFEADIRLPAMLYVNTIKALEYALKNNFSHDVDTIYDVRETLQLMKKAIKDPIHKS